MTSYTPVLTEATLYASSSVIPIDGFGTLDILVKKQDNKTMTITLCNVAFVPSFHTSVVSLWRFEAIGGA